MKKFIVTTIIIGFFLEGYTQTSNLAKLDSFLYALSSRNLAMGSLAIFKNDKPYYQKTFGYAYIGEGQKTMADALTTYRIGSISKMFTATMVFQLVEEGKLTLTTTLAEFFPDLPNARNITIANMLYHRSGLHDYTHDTDFDNWMDKPMKHEELLNIIQQKGTDFAPNTKADYCNTNFLLLGYIIEKITRSSYADQLKKRITEKLDLKHTRYGSASNPKNNEAASYKYSEGQWMAQKETDSSIHGGAGSIISTPQDMIHFIEALFAHKLITKKSLTQMTTLVDGYGMGIFPDKYGAKPSFGHNGKVEEFASALWYFPSEKISIAYVSNGMVYPRDEIMEGILKICFHEPFVIPFSKPIVSKSGELDKYAGKYTSQQLPFAVTCSVENNQLYLEANGKKFEAEPINENYFMNKPSGTFFEFLPATEEMLIKESHNVYYTTRQRP